MQRLEVSGAVRPIYESLGVKRLTDNDSKNVENVGDVLLYFMALPCDVSYGTK